VAQEYDKRGSNSKEWPWAVPKLQCNQRMLEPRRINVFDSTGSISPILERPYNFRALKEDLLGRRTLRLKHMESCQQQAAQYRSLSQTLNSISKSLFDLYYQSFFDIEGQVKVTNIDIEFDKTTLISS
jgi:hypothetical protein